MLAIGCTDFGSLAARNALVPLGTRGSIWHWQQDLATIRGRVQQVGPERKVRAT